MCFQSFLPIGGLVIERLSNTFLRSSQDVSLEGTYGSHHWVQRGCLWQLGNTVCQCSQSFWRIHLHLTHFLKCLPLYLPTVWTSISTVLIICWEKTSRLCHNFWNLKSYSFGVKNQQVWLLHSHAHKCFFTASGVAAPAPGTEDAETLCDISGLLALTLQQGRWTWKLLDSIEWYVCHDQGLQGTQMLCIGGELILSICLLSGRGRTWEKISQIWNWREGRGQINKHFLSTNYVSSCQTLANCQRCERQSLTLKKFII